MYIKYRPASRPAFCGNKWNEAEGACRSAAVPTLPYLTMANLPHDKGSDDDQRSVYEFRDGWIDSNRLDSNRMYIRGMHYNTAAACDLAVISSGDDASSAFAFTTHACGWLAWHWHAHDIDTCSGIVSLVSLSLCFSLPRPIFALVDPQRPEARDELRQGAVRGGDERVSEGKVWRSSPL